MIGMFGNGKNKMNKGTWVFILLYLMLSVIGTLNILIWGGYVREGLIPYSTLSLYLYVGTSIVTIGMVFFNILSLRREKA